ncbi:DNA topoisomerase 3 [Mechercharimyces sp. CAU 1602]|uniref:DNA topoisomerase 3 n=1 Tax=Mechercharimyces sp. CAU 1602 TaxID=2973933 RepID=UPI00216181DF|nr:DNA topoisomerase 3 [Mechercharimyces sp. CAU 1602]MCS1350940.1 DNA topoisomerase 3 [Mechercharimyces sp. CAU 1602]
MKLVITEKPDQMRKLAACFPIQTKSRDSIRIKPCTAFPQGAVFVTCYGHIVRLQEPHEIDPVYKRWSLQQLPILPETLKYKVEKSKAKSFQLIKQYVNDPEVTSVIIATDPAREGEAIARLPLMLAKNRKPIERLWTSSLTDAAIKKAFLQLKDGKETYPLFQEAQARAISDWMIGMNGSRTYTLLLQRAGIGKEVFSVGRVQTALLRLLYDREIAIEQHVPTPYYEVFATFNMNEKIYEGKLFLEDSDRIAKKAQALRVKEFCHDQEAIITDIKKERQVIRPPKLFDLNSLQTTANRRFKYPPSQTLKIAQSLYEKSLISYPRTNSAFVSAEEIDSFADILQQFQQKRIFPDFVPPPKKPTSLLQDKRFCNPSKIEDHYAIIPTEKVPLLAKMGTDERNIYELVAQRLIAAHYPDALYDTTEIITVVSERAFFRTKGKQLVDLGWKVVFGGEEKEEKKKGNEDEIALPSLDKGEQGRVTQVEIKEKITQPKPRITAGQMINVMKNAYDYIEDKDKKRFKKTELSIGTPATRASIIDTLQQRSYIENHKNEIFVTAKGRVLIEAIGDHLITSPMMTASWETYLHQIGRGEKEAAPFIAQSKKVCNDLLQHAQRQASSWRFTPIAEAPSPVKKKPKKKSTPVKSQTAGVNTPSLGACPLCEQGKITEEQNGYRCSVGTCSFLLPFKWCGKALSKRSVKKMIVGEATQVLKGFKSKSGKKFDAALTYDSKQQKIIPQFTQSK